MYYISSSIKIVLILAFIIGLFNFKKFKNSPSRYFLYFLGYGIATEIFGGLFFYKLFKFPNYILYNFYAAVQFVFYLWLLGKYLKSKKTRKIIKTFMSVILIFFIFNTIFFQNILLGLQSYFFLFGGILLIITIILFFIEILNSNAVLDIKHFLIFWVATGVLLFQLGFIPVFIAKNYINHSQGLTYGYILLLLNFISSTCFSLGFIWSRKGVNY